VARPGDELQVLACAMGDGAQTLLWIIDPDYNYPNGAQDATPRTLAKVEVNLPGLPDGACDIEFRDTRAGKATGTTQAKAAGGNLRVEFPTLQVDTAARIRPVH